MLKIKIGFCLHHPIEGLLHDLSVVGMNPRQYHLQRRLYRSIEFKDIVAFRRPIDFSAGNTPAEAASVAYALPFSEESFAALQLLMGFLALINVRNQDIPTDDTAFRVSRWQAAYHEPAVDAVGAKDTVFDIIRVPGFYRLEPARRHHLAFIRM